MTSRGHAFGPTAMVADTKTAVGTAYKVPHSGKIRFIRVTGYNGVTDKATNAILTLESDQQKGPFEWAIYGAGEEITVGGKRPTEVVECDIDVIAQEQITISLTASEALEDVVASIVWE